jgi:lipid II:glycine glycyltransferase (peptidoglycan interpeptide bridge formation enzyme)
LVADLDAVCHRRGAATLIIEPVRRLPLRGTYRRAGFVRGPAHMQVVETIKVPLGDDDEMLARMRKQTRRTVRRGERRGVVAERAPLGDDAAFSTFHALLGETGERHGFPLRPRAYYEEVLRLFGDDAVLLLAMVDGEAVAGELGVRFGDEAHSLFAGSSTLRRVNGATAYLEFELLRWARDQGCRTLDLWGTDWVGMPDEGTAWYKLGFGGEIVSYPPTLERRYRPIVSWCIRRALALYHASVT